MPNIVTTNGNSTNANSAITNSTVTSNGSLNYSNNVNSNGTSM